MHSGKPAGEFNVLMIEDAPATAAILQMYMEEMGLPDPCWVATVSEAKALRPKIDNGDFDLILSDLTLSDCGAAPFLEDVMAHTDCPVVICSGQLELGERDKSGVFATLIKPVSFETLRSTMARAGAREELSL